MLPPHELTMIKAIPYIFITIIPFILFGDNVLQGQLNGLIFCVFFTSILFIPNIFLKVIGFLMVGWLGFAYLAGFMINFPVAPYIEGSLILITGIAFFLFVFYTDISIDIYFKAICVSALLQALLAVCQWWWFDPVSRILSYIITVTVGGNDIRTPVGTLGNKNFLGAYLAISLPFFFRSKWVWLSPIILLGIYISWTLTAIIGAVAGIIFFVSSNFRLNKKARIILIGCGLMAIGLFVIHSGKETLSNVRILYWIDAWHKVSVSYIPLFLGYGQGVTWKIGDQLHSEYVAALFHYGLIGLSCMVLYIINIYRQHKILFTAFLVLCINMIANHPLHVVSTALLAIAIIALIEREKVKNEKTKI